MILDNETQDKKVHKWIKEYTEEGTVDIVTGYFTVQKCLEAKGQNCQKWEQEIDERVARLYGLTDQEMQIIKGLNTD